MTTFIALLARLAAVDDADLARPDRWRGIRVGARYARLFRTLEIEQEAVVAARISYLGTEAQRILGLAQIAYGDLRGVLAGVGSEALDRSPAEGEWSARRTLEHAIGVERSYRANTRHAIVRGADEPLTLPAERRPQPDPADTAGDGSALAEHLGARRAETDADLGRITEDEMTRASHWGALEEGLDVDVRFRLHRFASHLVEHTVQCERALEAAGVVFGDARRVVRRISVLRAMHERITPAAELARLDAGHAQRLAGAGAGDRGRAP